MTILLNKLPLDVNISKHHLRVKVSLSANAGSINKQTHPRHWEHGTHVCLREMTQLVMFSVAQHRNIRLGNLAKTQRQFFIYGLWDCLANQLQLWDSCSFITFSRRKSSITTLPLLRFSICCAFQLWPLLCYVLVPFCGNAHADVFTSFKNRCGRGVILTSNQKCASFHIPAVWL